MRVRGWQNLVQLRGVRPTGAVRNQETYSTNSTAFWKSCVWGFGVKEVIYAADGREII